MQLVAIPLQILGSGVARSHTLVEIDLEIKSEDFLLNLICIMYIIVCLYMLFYVQSIQIKYV